MVQKVNFNNLTGDTLTIGNTVITGTGVTVDGSALGGGGVSATTLTKTFANNEVYTMTLDNAIEGAPIVGATRLGGGVGTVTKDNWDVNSTASNYDIWNEAPSTDTLKVYANACPYQVHGGTYVSHTAFTALTPTEGAPYDFTFNDDGTKFFMVGTTTDDIESWTLPTPYDISSNTTTGDNFAGLGLISGFDFSRDGTFVIIADTSTDDIYAYTLSTAWDLSTATQQGSLDPGVALSQNNTGCYRISPDGKFIYFVASDDVYFWELSTAFDVTTAGTMQFYSTAINSDWVLQGINSPGNAAQMRFLGDGSQILFLEQTGEDNIISVITLTLKTPGDIRTVDLQSHHSSLIICGPNDGSDTSAGASSNMQLNFSIDGTKFFIIDTGADELRTYTSGPGVQKSSGYWSPSDRNKRIIANSGEIYLLDTMGNYATKTAMASTSNVGAGNWYLYGADVNSTKGITTTKYEYRGEFPSIAMTETSDTLYESLNVTAPPRLDNNGTLYTIIDTATDTMYYATLSTPYLLSSVSIVRNSFDLTNGGALTIGTLNSHSFKPDGTAFYTYDNVGVNGTIYEYSLSTAWDMSTASYTASHDNIETLLSPYGTSATFIDTPDPDGNYIYICATQTGGVHRIDMSTAWDLTTLSFTTGQFFRDPINFNFGAMRLSPNGQKLAIYSNNDHRWIVYPIPTAWDLSSMDSDANGNSNRTVYSTRGTKLYGIDYFEQTNYPTGDIRWKDNEVYEWFAYGGNKDHVLKYKAYMQKNYDDWVIAITNSSGQIDTSSWIDLNTFTPDESVPSDSQIVYAMSRDNKQSFEIVTESGGVRTIALLDTVWKYNQANVHSANSFAVATSNSAYGALYDAISWSETNRWSNSQISIVTDDNNFPSANSSFFANTFDLAIMMKHGSAYSNQPTSDAISINYDSAIRERGAILGTHYTWVKESNTEIEITVLEDAGSNYKFRVI